MLTCEECGCLVDPEATDVHADWHEKLVKKNELTSSALANRHRTKLDHTNMNYLD
jgi:transcription initiation factor TFIIIB Brf1 subunit/transcription initiation factor TFIIB